MNVTGYILAIIGAAGLGLLVGSEYSGSSSTVVGATLVVTSIIGTVVFSFKNKKYQE